MHLSTRILLLLVALVAIVGGWWLIRANNDLPLALIYGALWTVAVLVAARILLAIGSGFNRLTSGRAAASEAGPTDAAGELARLSDLRDRELLSAEEYESKRSKILDRL